MFIMKQFYVHRICRLSHFQQKIIFVQVYVLSNFYVLGAIILTLRKSSSLGRTHLYTRWLFHNVRYSEKSIGWNVTKSSERAWNTLFRYLKKGIAEPAAVLVTSFKEKLTYLHIYVFEETDHDNSNHLAINRFWWRSLHIWTCIYIQTVLLEEWEWQIFLCQYFWFLVSVSNRIFFSSYCNLQRQILIHFRHVGFVMYYVM